MTVGQLKHILGQVPEEYEAHLEGQEIGTVELHEREHATLNCGGQYEFKKHPTEGVVNLLSLEADEG